MTSRIKETQALYSPQAKLRRMETSDLVKSMLRISRTLNLTQRQKEVLGLILAGFTQEDVGRILGISQTSVHKILFGNLVYHGRYAGRRHGGILAKLRKVGEREEAVNEIWNRIKVLFYNPVVA